MSVPGNLEKGNDADYKRPQDNLVPLSNINELNFENDMKLEYTGLEDEIIKKIEVGNVSLPLNGTLITGSQSLFGLKTKLQFGRTTITGVLSQQKSTTSQIQVTGGAQTTEFDIYADKVQANEWDDAAGHAIAEHAGAIVTNLDEDLFQYGKTDYKKIMSKKSHIHILLC